jgi:hypothetical protein
MLGHARNGVVRESLERAGAQMISKVSYPHSRRRARSHAAAASLSRLPPPPGIVELPTIALRHGSFRLLRPSFPASDWSFTDLGTPASLGRPARIVRVRRRGGAVDRGAGHWPGLDDHECVVDDALRIPLRITGRVGSRDAVDHAATKLHVDAALGGETFSIRPAESTRAVVVQRYGA